MPNNGNFNSMFPRTFPARMTRVSLAVNKPLGIFETTIVGAKSPPPIKIPLVADSIFSKNTLIPTVLLVLLLTFIMLFRCLQD